MPFRARAAAEKRPECARIRPRAPEGFDHFQSGASPFSTRATSLTRRNPLDSAFSTRATVVEACCFGCEHCPRRNPEPCAPVVRTAGARSERGFLRVSIHPFQPGQRPGLARVRRRRITAGASTVRHVATWRTLREGASFVLQAPAVSAVSLQVSIHPFQPGQPRPGRSRSSPSGEPCERRCLAYCGPARSHSTKSRTSALRHIH